MFPDIVMHLYSSTYNDDKLEPMMKNDYFSDIIYSIYLSLVHHHRMILVVRYQYAIVIIMNNNHRYNRYRMDVYLKMVNIIKSVINGLMVMVVWKKPVHACLIN